MKKIFLVLLTAAMTVACNSGDSTKAGIIHENVPAGTAVNAESDAYRAGASAANALLKDNLSGEELHDRLLDTRAVISLIQRRHGIQDAADYQAGFTDAIIAGNDSLAREIAIL